MKYISVRRLICALSAAAGLIAATAGPASAGFGFANHCETLRPR